MDPENYKNEYFNPIFDTHIKLEFGTFDKFWRSGDSFEWTYECEERALVSKMGSDMIVWGRRFAISGAKLVTRRKILRDTWSETTNENEGWRISNNQINEKIVFSSFFYFLLEQQMQMGNWKQRWMYWCRSQLLVSPFTIN